MNQNDPNPSPRGQRLRESPGVLLERAVAALSSFPPPGWRRPLLAGAAITFLVGGTYFTARLDTDWSALGWRWLVLASVVGVPLTVVANALEFQLSSRLLGGRIHFSRSAKIAVLATAANLLPLPGGALVRVQALKQSGHGYSRATYATAILAGSWVGVATLLTGILLLLFGFLPTGALWTVFGVGLLVLAATLAGRRIEAHRLRFTLAVLGVELLSVSVAGFRLLFVLVALGEAASLPAAALLAFAGVAAAAVGIFPGGLGLREVLSATLVPITGIAAATGFIASAIDRVLGLMVHAPLALYYASKLADDPDTHGLHANSRWEGPA